MFQRALSRDPFRRRGQSDAAAALPLGRTRHLGENFARSRIVLANRILADVDEPLVVDVHAVPLRGIERSDEVARPVELQHRRRAGAALGNRWRQFRQQFHVRQIVGSVEYPDVTFRVHGEPGNAAELPVVRQRFRPGWVLVVVRRRLSADAGGPEGQ